MATKESTIPGIIVGEKVPVYSWTSHDLDDKTREQILNLAKLPFAIHHVALMPDAHAGYGMPIGGVLFADSAVVPYAIGVDIGCGVSIARTNLVWGHNFDKEKLKNVLHQIQRDVPTGFSQHQKPVMDEVDLLLKLNQRGIDATEAFLLTPDLDAWVNKVMVSIGTLGGGNHFLEIQRDADGAIYFMLHSGSRNLGQQICKYYHKMALELNTMWHSDLPHPELAYLPMGTKGFAGYMGAMNLGLAWAEINRAEMMKLVRQAFIKQASAKDFDVINDVHHNFAAFENHYGQNGIVHRKGAVRARTDDEVLIPGSMGTNSYIATGKSKRESFNTCQHGAGRAVGRKAMERQMDSTQLKTIMKELDVVLVSNAKGEAVVQEAPSAYKDIDVVMAASTDLVDINVKLWPLGVVKG